MQKVDGSNPFSRFFSVRRIADAPRRQKHSTSANPERRKAADA
jgi:hypothetical protein